MKKYSINQVCKEFDIRLDDGCDKGRLLTEDDKSNKYANLNDLGRLGAYIMRLRDRIEILENKKGEKNARKNKI